MNMQTWATIVVFAVVLGFPGATAEGAEGESRSPATELPGRGVDGIWEGAVGEGFRKHASEAGISLGTGFGVKTFGTTRDHDLAFSTFQYGLMLTRVQGQGKWYAGNFELAAQLTTGAQYHPEATYFFSLTPVLRYNLATGTRFVPFLGAGAGPAMTNIGRPDLGSHFEFHDHAETGLHWFFRDPLAATIQVGFGHISNAGLARPNHGVNCAVVTAGVNWFF